MRRIELTYLLNCRSKIKQNVLFQRFKQKMSKATLLKGNSTPETFRLNDNATSATRSISIQVKVQLCKRVSCLVPLLNP